MYGSLTLCLAFRLPRHECPYGLPLGHDGGLRQSSRGRHSPPSAAPSALTQPRLVHLRSRGVVRIDHRAGGPPACERAHPWWMCAGGPEPHGWLQATSCPRDLCALGHDRQTSAQHGGLRTHGLGRPTFPTFGFSLVISRAWLSSPGVGGDGQLRPTWCGIDALGQVRVRHCRVSGY